jgi:hypothetical protein
MATVQTFTLLETYYKEEIMDIALIVVTFLTCVLWIILSIGCGIKWQRTVGKDSDGWFIAAALSFILAIYRLIDAFDLISHLGK